MDIILRDWLLWEFASEKRLMELFSQTKASGVGCILCAFAKNPNMSHWGDFFFKKVTYYNFALWSLTHPVNMKL